MKVVEAIEARSTERVFSEDKVPVKDLREMVRCAGLAPSISNEQPWRFIAVTNEGMLFSMANAVHAAIDQLFPNEKDGNPSRAKAQVDWFSTVFEGAPALILVATTSPEAEVDKQAAQGRISQESLNVLRNHPDVQSIGAAIQNVLLRAVDLGYGTCWINGLTMARSAVEECVGLPDGWNIVSGIAIGRAIGHERRSKKKPVDAIFKLID